MKFQEYSQLLKDAIIANIYDCSIWVAIIIICCLGSNLKKRKKSALMFGMTIVVLIEIALCAGRCLPAVNDILNESYVCIHGEYYMYNFNYRYDDDNAVQVTSDSGTTTGMILPRKWGSLLIDKERFPSGRYIGTVWYSENSKFILEFIPDEADNNS